MKRTILAALVLFAGAAYAQPTPVRIPPKYTVATAPSCVDGEPKLYSVTDGNSSTDCAVGGGSTDVICKCIDGTASAVGSGGGAAGNSFETINAPAGTDPVADSSTDTLNVTCSGGLTCTGDSATDTLDFAMGTASLATALAANGANCSAGQFPLGVDASGAVESCSTSLSGNADTATALAANPADCAANQYANAIAASGNLTCAAISDADVPNNITITLAGTATALAANGANCSAGQYPLGVDASGAAESCTADDDTPDSDSEVPDNITVTGSVSPSTFTFPASAAPAQTTDAAAAWDSDDNRLTVGDGASTLVIYPGAHAGAVTDGGAATTATALAANGANCSAGQYPLGVDASGAVESCTADSTTPASDSITEAMLKAVDAAGDEECLTYESTVGDFEWQSCGSAGIGGSAGATDNAILRADGTGGATLQTSPVTIADTTGTMTFPAGATFNLTTASGGLIASGADGWFYFDGHTSMGAKGPAGGGSPGEGFRLNSGAQYAFTNSERAYNTVDTGLARSAAGVVKVTDGSTGIGKLLTAVLVEANTAGSGTPNAIAATESGTVFTNEGVTAKNFHTLPSAVAGYRFTFIVQDADGLRITANTGDDIRIGATTSTTAGYCESTTIGDSVTLVAINATNWYAISLVGSGWTCA